MLDLEVKHEKCTICKHEYTSIYTEAAPGIKIYVCDTCLEAAKHNFIWVCIGCGQVYLRPKKLVIERTLDPELKRAFILCEDMQMIQGIDMCVSCDADGIMNYMDAQKTAVC